MRKILLLLSWLSPAFLCAQAPNINAIWSTEWENNQISYIDLTKKENVTIRRVIAQAASGNTPRSIASSTDKQPEIIRVLDSSTQGLPLKIEVTGIESTLISPDDTLVLQRVSFPENKNLFHYPTYKGGLYRKGNDTVLLRHSYGLENCGHRFQKEQYYSQNIDSFLLCYVNERRREANLDTLLFSKRLTQLSVLENEIKLQEANIAGKLKPQITDIRTADGFYVYPFHCGENGLLINFRYPEYMEVDYKFSLYAEGLAKRIVDEIWGSIGEYWQNLMNKGFVSFGLNTLYASAEKDDFFVDELGRKHEIKKTDFFDQNPVLFLTLSFSIDP